MFSEQTSEAFYPHDSPISPELTLGRSATDARSAGRNDSGQNVAICGAPRSGAPKKTDSTGDEKCILRAVRSMFITCSLRILSIERFSPITRKTKEILRFSTFDKT